MPAIFITAALLFGNSQHKELYIDVVTKGNRQVVIISEDYAEINIDVTEEMKLGPDAVVKKVCKKITCKEVK